LQKLAGAEIVKLAGFRKARQAEVEDLLRDFFGGRQRHRVFAGHHLRPHAGAGRAGIEQIDPDRRRRCFGGISLPQHIERRFRYRIGTAIGPCMSGGARRHKHGPAGFGALEQRIHGADQVPVRGDIDGHDFVPGRRLDMIERRARTGHGGIADQHIKPLVALVERRSEPVKAGVIAHVERHQRRRTAGGTRRVI
jgi:hypothetical protein